MWGKGLHALKIVISVCSAILPSMHTGAFFDRYQTCTRKHGMNTTLLKTSCDNDDDDGYDDDDDDDDGVLLLAHFPEI